MADKKIKWSDEALDRLLADIKNKPVDKPVDDASVSAMPKKRLKKPITDPKTGLPATAPKGHPLYINPDDPDHVKDHKRMKWMAHLMRARGFTNVDALQHKMDVERGDKLAEQQSTKNNKLLQSELAKTERIVYNRLGQWRLLGPNEDN